MPRNRFNIGAFALTLVWLGVNAYPYQAPAPRFSEADLPSLPPASTNGWHALTSEPLALELPTRLSSLVSTRAPADQFWADVERQPHALTEFMATRGAHEANRRIDAALAQTAFADACRVGQPCQTIARHQAHVVALLRAVELVRAGDPIAGVELIRDLVRIDAAQLGSARSSMSLVVALSDLGDVLHIADMIAARLSGGHVESQLRAKLDRLDREVRALTVDRLDLRAVVVTDYLSELQTFEAPIEFGPSWLYSRALTLQTLGERAQRRHQAAVAGDVFAALGGEQPQATESLGWWWRNPVGEQAIDAIAFEPTTLTNTIERERADVQRQRASLLARLPTVNETQAMSCARR